MNSAEPNIMFFGMEGDFPFQLWNLLFLFPPVAKAVYDTFYTEAKHFPVIHKQSLALLCTVSFPGNLHLLADI
jgi:hypothetical protein